MMAEHIGTVTNREEKEISKGDNKGQPFLKVTLEPEKWTYSLFDGQHIKTAKQNNSLKVTWEEDGKFRNVTGVEVAERTEVEAVTNEHNEFARWQSCEVTAREIMCKVIENYSELDTGTGKHLTESTIGVFRDFYRAVRTEVDDVVSVIYTPSIERSSEDIAQSEDTLVAEIKKLADGQTIRDAMDKLGYTEAKLSDCDAGQLAAIREEVKPSG